MKKKQEILINALSTLIRQNIESQNLKKTIFCYENDICISKFYALFNGTRDVYGTTLIITLLALGVDLGELSIFLKEFYPELFSEIVE